MYDAASLSAPRPSRQACMWCACLQSILTRPAVSFGLSGSRPAHPPPRFVLPHPSLPSLRFFRRVIKRSRGIPVGAADPHLWHLLYRRHVARVGYTRLLSQGRSFLLATYGLCLVRRWLMLTPRHLHFGFRNSKASNLLQRCMLRIWPVVLPSTLECIGSSVYM